MPNFNWHDYLVFISLIACIAGLILLFYPDQITDETGSSDERMLLMMTFSYWTVYCLATVVQKLQLPDWEILLLSLKFTALISYCLTCSCILILPLRRLASRYAE